MGEDRAVIRRQDKTITVSNAVAEAAGATQGTEAGPQEDHRRTEEKPGGPERKLVLAGQWRDLSDLRGVVGAQL